MGENWAEPWEEPEQKIIVRSKDDNDFVSSCGKDCSAELITPTDGATNVGTWGEQA